MPRALPPKVETILRRRSRLKNDERREKRRRAATGQELMIFGGKRLQFRLGRKRDRRGNPDDDGYGLARRRCMGAGKDAEGTI